MPSAARLGTFADLLDDVPDDAAPHVRPVAEALRAVILAQLPDAVEVVRLGDRAASYGVGERKMIESHAYVQAHRDRVNLGFWHGAALPDPAGLLEGTGKTLRHVKVRTVGQAEAPAVAALIAAALAERRAALKP